MPEVREALEATVRDPVPAIRCVVGERFTTTFYFDAAWTTQHLDDIFPTCDALRAIWQASWGTFVDYSQPYDPAYEILKERYALAVARLRDATDESRKRMGERGLGNHLASYYWRSIGGEHSHRLLLEYFEWCSPVSAGLVVHYFAQGLEGKEPIAPSTMTALTALWGELMAQSPSWGEQKNRELIRQFGRWFASARFDAEWSLAELERCLRTGAGLLDLQDVIVHLARLAASHPAEVSVCVELVLKDDRELWRPLTWQAELASVLTTLLRSSDGAVRTRTESIVDRLVESGSLFARDLQSGGDGVNGAPVSLVSNQKAP
jgi:hypothetical protein